MKFLSVFEEQNKVQSEDWHEQYIKGYEFVCKEVKDIKIGLFIDSHDLNYDLHNIREESKELVEDFGGLVEKLDDEVKNRSVVVDTAIEADAGGGFTGDLVPSFSTILKAVLVFVVAQSVTGFLQEAGKDFYLWIKTKRKEFGYVKNKHVYVILRGKKKEAKFLFQSNFTEEIFENAWKEMLNVNVDRLDIEKYEERIFIFDTKENKWVEFN